MTPNRSQNGGGEKWLFRIGAPPRTTSRPRGTLGPPKVKMEPQGPPGMQKAPQNDSQGTPWSPWDLDLKKYPQKAARNQNNQKGSHKCIQIVFVQEREKHLQQTKKRNSWNSPNNQDNQNTKKTNQDNPTKIAIRTTHTTQTAQTNPRNSINKRDCPRIAQPIQTIKTNQPNPRSNSHNQDYPAFQTNP